MINALDELKTAKSQLDRVAFGLSQWTPMSGELIDPSGRVVTFENGFYQIAPGDSTQRSYWYAGAQGGPYGLANVGNAVRPDCYERLGDDGVRITANRTPGGDPARVGGWYSGHLQTVNVYGQGFAQRYGYFEAELRLPMAWMAWPAFWLKHRDKWTDPAAVNVELDVLEHYGLFLPARLHSTIHHDAHGADRQMNETVTTTSVNLTQRHRYGVLLDRDWITVYFDRRAIARHPMHDDFRQELYPCLTLSIDGRAEQVAHVAEVPATLSLDVLGVTVYR